MAAQRQDIDYIAGRLDKFAHVWAMVRKGVLVCSDVEFSHSIKCQVAHDAREVHAKLKGLSEGIHDPEGVR